MLLILLHFSRLLLNTLKAGVSQHTIFFILLLCWIIMVTGAPPPVKTVTLLNSLLPGSRKCAEEMRVLPCFSFHNNNMMMMTLFSWLFIIIMIYIGSLTPWLVCAHRTRRLKRRCVLGYVLYCSLYMEVLLVFSLILSSHFPLLFSIGFYGGWCVRFEILCPFFQCNWANLEICCGKLCMRP